MARVGTIRGVLLALLLVAVCAAGAEPKRVLILYSFGRRVAPFSEVAAAFRTTLVRQLNHGVVLYETSLDLAQFEAPVAEGAFADFLAQRFARRRLDLIVTIGAPAADFAARHRKRLFPAIPMLVVGLDKRFLPPEPLRTNSTVVTGKISFSGMVANILHILPKTKNIVVAIGSSPLERSWLAQMRRQFAPFIPRVRFIWFNRLPVEEMQRRAAALPAHSVILFGPLVRDAAGVPYEHYAALKRLRAAANAPIFGYFESQLGLGIVGGRLYQERAVGVRAARAAIRILRGEAPAAITPRVLVTALPRYDWRELRRWSIDEARLPAGSEVLYRAPSLWMRYKWHIIAAMTLGLAQALFILALLLNRRRLRIAQSDLHESEQRMRLAAEITKLGLWVWDIRDNAVWVSESSRALFGLAPAQSIDFERFLERLHPEDGESTRQAMQRCLEGEGHYAAQCRILLSEQGTRWIAMQGRVEFDRDGKPARLLGASIDITERKSAELEVQHQRRELAHVSRVGVMGELAASIAHELNQPLTAILSNAQAAQRLLARPPSDLQEIKDILADIVRDDKRAGEIIRRMRALVRKEAREWERVCINHVIQEVTKLLCDEALLRTVKIETRLERRPPTVVGDPIQLQQVLINLYVNAFEAMAQNVARSRELMVRSKTACSGGMILVTVTDNGPGVPADRLEKIFQPFYSSKQQGLGMGLAVSRTLIDAHGGRMWAAKNRPRGAKICIELPAQTTDKNRVSSGSPALLRTPEPGSDRATAAIRDDGQGQRSV
ncbi:MAG: ATP-binding protein [Nitrococcus sp.]|nr:ATP-binding protein [Nitrococcus sp.]